MEDKIIKFRPHHFMCTLGFQGKGYSLDFVRNYRNIHKTLKEDENTLIEVVKYMTLEKFDQACTGCDWKKYGVCAESLKMLLNIAF